MRTSCVPHWSKGVPSARHAADQLRRSVLTSTRWIRTLVVGHTTVRDEVICVADLKGDLWSRLREARATILAGTDGLSGYELRRPMTSTGTNLLGLVKHLVGEEFGYLGQVFDRPPKRSPTWFRDDPATEIDMWATSDESSGYIIDTYRQAAVRADQTIRLLRLDSPGVVPHWAHQRTTLGSMLILMVGETEGR